MSDRRPPTMLKALAWKEWHEQRPVVVAGVVFVGILSAYIVLSRAPGAPSTDEIVDAYAAAFLGIVWPFIAAAAGALTVANEQESGTLRFLLSRPVSRPRLWFVKVTVALLAVVVVAMLSLVVAWVPVALVSFFTADVATLTPTMDTVWATTLPPVALASLSVLLFACAALSSTLLDRPLTAAAAGLALALALLAVVLLVWNRLSLIPRLEPQWFVTEVLVVAFAVLLIALIVFARSELFNCQQQGILTPGRLMIAGVVVLALLAGVLPLGYANANFDAGNLVVNSGSMTFNGQHVAMAVSQRGGDTAQIWLLEPDGSGVRPVAGRHTYAPRFFPGRSLLVYLSQRGTDAPFDRANLRAVDTRTSEDHLVAAGVSPGKPLFLSRLDRESLGAGEYATFLDGGRLIIARLDGGGAEIHDVSDTGLEESVLLGYNDASPPELLFVEDASRIRGYGRRATALRAYSVARAESRLLRLLPDKWEFLTDEQRFAFNAPPNGWSVIPIRADGEIFMVDAVTGEAEFVVAAGDSPVAGMAFRGCTAATEVARRTWSASEGSGYGERQVLFSDCTEAARSQAITDGGVSEALVPPAGLIRLRGLESGDERVWVLPDFESPPNRLRLGKMWLSRNQDQVLIYVYGGYQPDPDGRVTYGRPPFAILLTHGGEPRVYPAGSVPLGWLPGARILFWQKRRGGGVAFATADAINDRSAELRDLYSIGRAER